MRIAILGFGTVGKGTYDIIKESGLSYIEVVKILRRSKSEGSIFTDNFGDIINDDSIDTIVECLGGLEPARTYIIEAMKKGKNVVTSNKLVLASCYDEFINLANEKNVYFLFEASVGGGVPIIENLFRIGFVDEVTGFKGIVNGTTNYILDKLTNSSAEYVDVLSDAQKFGYAEKDPSSDVDGDDAMYKSIILANVASKKSYSMDNFLKLGLRNISKADIDFFKYHNLVCKLIAEYDATHNRILVMPELFNRNAIIANVPLNNNFIEVYCKTEGKLLFMGQGAGSYPTGHSVVQDLVRIEQNAVVPTLTTEKVYISYSDFSNRFYIKRKGCNGEFVDGMSENDLRSEDLLFAAKVNL